MTEKYKFETIHIPLFVAIALLCHTTGHDYDSLFTSGETVWCMSIMRKIRPGGCR
jgi:hypothetical protein